MNKKMIAPVIIIILIVGILLYLFFPRSLAGKFSSQNELLLSEIIPVLNVEEDKATPDIISKEAYVKPNDKNYNEVMDLIKEIKYYPGFKFITKKNDNAEKYLYIADYDSVREQSTISIVDSGYVDIGEKIYLIYGGSQKAKEIIQEIERKVELKEAEVEYVD